jgi:DNA-binding transcriptional regulator YdaS (Cro superfamily)
MITERELRREVLLRAREAGSQKALAAKIGVSEQVLSFLVAGSRRPSSRLLSALGYEKVVGYRKGKERG